MYSPGVNILGSRENGRQFLGDRFKCTFLNANIQISIIIKFVP